jgi:hypothetical protein
MLGGKYGGHMGVPEVYWMQFYRRGPGDLGIDDLPVPSSDDFEQITGNALLGYFNNSNIAPQQRPNHARVVSHDRAIVILTLMVIDPQTVERIANAA